MKNKVYLLAITSITLLATTLNIFAGTIPKINVNGNKILVPESPFMQNNRIFVPLRTVSENLGAKVTWDNQARMITIQQGDNIISCLIGDEAARVNNQIIRLDASVQLKNGKTYVPLRFVSEALGGEVKYDSTKNTVDIVYKLPVDGSQKYDYYGRELRTTNLPSNAKDFPYILKSIPNEMYEMKTKYEISSWVKPPIENKDYVKAVNLNKIYSDYDKEALDIFKKMIEKNLETRLNVDYKTINFSWSNKLKSTYFNSFNSSIDEYVSYVKNNKLVIEGDYYVEPSTTYYCSGPIMRCWVKFRISSDKVKEATLFQSHQADLKTNSWYEGYVDISVMSKNGGLFIEDFRIVDDHISGMPTVKVSKNIN